jgi:general secretion pathway protein G
MEKARQRHLAGQGGFTLVELIVVIAILGILAGIVVFAVGGINNKGQSEANKTTCSVLQTAEEAYFAKVGSYVTDDGATIFVAPATSAQDALRRAGFLHTVDPAFVIHAGAATDPTPYLVTGPQCTS